MNRQVCEYDVQRILDRIGGNDIMLQLDGYESYLNGISSVDVEGHINEVVSPGDCTDLCSTIDQEIGSFIKAHFNIQGHLRYKGRISRGGSKLPKNGDF